MEDNNKKETLNEEQKANLKDMYNRYFNMLPEALRVELEMIVCLFGQVMSIALTVEEENEHFTALEKMINRLRDHHLEEFKRLTEDWHEKHDNENKEDTKND